MSTAGVAGRSQAGSSGSSAAGGNAAGAQAAAAGSGGASGAAAGGAPNSFAGASGAGHGGASGAGQSGGSSGTSQSAGSSGTSQSAGSSGTSQAGGPAALCSTTALWGGSSALAISTGADDFLGSLTPDELSLAFTTNANGAVLIEYADRASSADPFGTPKTLSGAFAQDRAALSPDGRVLVLVNDDRRGFTQYSRAARGTDFGNPGAGPLSAYAPAQLPPGHALADPLLAADDKTFIYSEYGSDVVDTIHQSKRLFGGDPWSAGSPLVAAELQALGPERRRPTGLSADGRTLFFWDDQAAQERAGFFPPDSNRLASVVDLGQLRGAQPNAACTRLYYSGPGQSSLELMVADAQ
jgi:hypothetical protein